MMDTRPLAVKMRDLRTPEGRAHAWRRTKEALWLPVLLPVLLRELGRGWGH